MGVPDIGNDIIFSNWRNREHIDFPIADIIWWRVILATLVVIIIIIIIIVSPLVVVIVVVALKDVLLNCFYKKSNFGM